MTTAITPGTTGDPIMFFDRKDGSGPYFHACGGLKAIRYWLDRQITIGGVTAAERAVIERLMDDLTEEEVADAAYNGILPPGWQKTTAQVVDATEAKSNPAPADGGRP